MINLKFLLKNIEQKKKNDINKQKFVNSKNNIINNGKK